MKPTKRTPEQRTELVQERIAKVVDGTSKELDLSNLGLDSIPSKVFELEKLETLKFMNNELSEIPYSLTNLRYLKALYLSGNQITEVSKRLLVDLPYLNCLDLGDNPFDYYEAADYFYNHNPWKGYAECLESIERHKRLGDEYFAYIGRLSVFPKEVFELTNLTTLSICGTHIKEVAPGIHRLKNLTRLNLEGNEIFELPDDIVELQKLEYISLTKNKFRVFPDILLELPALKYIHLAGNDIEYFPVDVVLDKRFKVVEASHNPIRNFNSGLFHLPMEEIRQLLRQ